MENALGIVKQKLTNTLNTYVSPGARVLDFGCGPGIYMSLLHSSYKVEGIDVSEAMIASAKEQLPDITFYQGNFLHTTFPNTYQAIYSISVLEYVPVSKIEEFFQKCASIREKNGVIFIPVSYTRLDVYKRQV